MMRYLSGAGGVISGSGSGSGSGGMVTGFNTLQPGSGAFTGFSKSYHLMYEL